MDDQLMLDGEGDDVQLVSARDDPARVCAKAPAAAQERLFGAPQTIRGQLAFGNEGLTNTR